MSAAQAHRDDVRSVKGRISPEAFRHVFRHHPAGVAVVTADAGNGPVAMTVSSVASVGLHPPTLVFSASARSSATPVIRRVETLVVHLLSSADIELAKLGAHSGVDRFGPEVEWARLPTGEPYYSRAGSWLRGRVVERVDAHGSTLLIVEAIESSDRSDQGRTEAKPLVYHDRSWYVLDEHSRLWDTAVPFLTVYGRGE